MTFFLGILLVPVALLIMKKANSVRTNKKNKILLNLALILLVVCYIVVCFVVNQEPLHFDVTYSYEYMFYEGEYILYAGLFCLFSPVVWVVFVHFIKMIFSSLRVRKNAKIKKSDDFIYYRGDLDKISPSTIMFASMYDVDLKKCISSSILKLKLLGYIIEKKDKFIISDNDTIYLSESDRMVLDFVKSGEINTSNYKKEIEKETLKDKYIVKYKGGKFFRLVKIFGAILIPIVIFIFSSWLDNYMLKNYNIYPEKDGHCYIYLEKYEDVVKAQEEVKDKKAFLQEKIFDKIEPNYSFIRADKLQYSVVRKTFLLNILGTFLISFGFIFILISIYVIVSEIKNFKKNYRRTIKGNILLNKAYALKNFLKDFSIIKDRSEEELVMWEYYLVYAVILGVNVNINDKVIEKYVNKIK